MRTKLASLMLLFALLVSCLGVAFSASPVFAYSSGKIAFRSESTGGFHEIFIMNTDGSSLTQLTYDNGDNREPCLSRDGTKIVYSNYNNDQIWVMNADGTNQHAVTATPSNGSDIQPSWSPDGTKIVFVSSRTFYYRLYIMNEDGTGQTMINSAGFPTGDCQWPSFNEDASRVAFYSNTLNTICTAKTDGTDVHQITTSSSPTHPVWSPDGAKIVFYTSWPYPIYTIDVDGSDQTNIGNGPDPSWAPDGSGIVYISAAGIAVMNSDGSDSVDIHKSPYDQEPSWGAGSVSPPASATITIVKNTLTVTDTFSFTGTGGQGLPASFTISPATPTTFYGGGANAPGYTGSQTYVVAPGSYTITESDLPADWSLYSSVDQYGIETLGEPVVTVTVADDEAATIEFYNSKAGEPGFPVPELPTITLLGIGLIAVGSFIFYKKHISNRQQT
jgi:Tol biopolymer transport system component